MQYFQTREVRKDDFQKGHTQLLSQLTEIGDLTQENYNEFIEYIHVNKSIYFLFVIEDLDTRKVVASGTLLVEQKLIHKLGRVGHIEDIIVDRNYRGFGLGKILIQKLKDKAQEMDCYKIILDCRDEKAGFYEKCGFHKREIMMRCNL